MSAVAYGKGLKQATGQDSDQGTVKVLTAWTCINQQGATRTSVRLKGTAASQLANPAFLSAPILLSG